jgi:hypothetical protein
VLPTQIKRQPFRELDWFTSRATAATIGAGVSRRKRAIARAIGTGPREPEGTQDTPSGELPNDVRPDDDDTGSEPEPDAEGDEDPLDPEPNFQRHPNQWKLWVMRRERRMAESASAFRPEPRGVAGRNPPVQAKSQSIKHFKGADGDLERFLRALKAHFRLTRVDDDMDRIVTTGMLLEDRAAEWYGAYLCRIDPDEARRLHGREVELEPIYRTWAKFETSLRDSFGGRVDRISAVDEWNRLRQNGSIDEFLDNVDRFMWITGYKGDVVKDKLRTGLSQDLAKEWSRVHPKPDTVNGQFALLRDMGHTAEDHERLESQRKDKSREPATSSHRSGQGKSRKGKSSSWKDRESSKSAPLRDEATKGISQEVLEQRKKDGVCLRCGKAGHKWSECWSKEPHKEKRKESSGDSGSSRWRAGAGELARSSVIH